MRNWQTLGDTDKANQSRSWAIGSIILLVVAGVSGVLFPEAGADLIARAVGLGLLIGWYTALGKKQVELVRDCYGTTYPRRSFLPPIAITIGIFAAAMIAIFFVIFTAVAAGDQ